MAGVTIEELGLRFVQICMENYWSGCLLPVFFLAGILWDIFYRRRKESRVFLYYLVFLALTVYNPVLNALLFFILLKQVNSVVFPLPFFPVTT